MATVAAFSVSCLMLLPLLADGFKPLPNSMAPEPVLTSRTLMSFSDMWKYFHYKKLVLTNALINIKIYMLQVIQELLLEKQILINGGVIPAGNVQSVKYELGPSGRSLSRAGGWVWSVIRYPMHLLGIATTTSCQMRAICQAGHFVTRTPWFFRKPVLSLSGLLFPFMVGDETYMAWISGLVNPDCSRVYNDCEYDSTHD